MADKNDAPRYGQRSENWTPDPQPPAGSGAPDEALQQSPWPVYQPGGGQFSGGHSGSAHSGRAQSGQTGATGNPAAGQGGPYSAGPYAAGPQRGTPYGGSFSPQSGPGGPGGIPKRTVPILLLVGGLVLALVIAPLVAMVTLMRAPVFMSMVDGSQLAASGSEIALTETEALAILPTDGSVPSGCTLTESSGDSLDLPYDASVGMVFASSVPAGTYEIDCGLPAGTPLYYFQGEQWQDLLSSAMSAVTWGTILGIGGIVAALVGLVTLIVRSRQRREYLRMYGGYPG